MKQETPFKWIAAAAGIFLALHWLFSGYDWWFPTLRQTTTITMGTTLCLIIGGGALFVIMSFGELRSKSEFIMTESDRASWNPAKDQPIVAGEWVIIPRGGINAMGMSFEGHDGAWIIHVDAWRRWGPNGLGISSTRLAIMDELPLEVQDRLRRTGIKGPYQWGVGPALIELRKRDFSAQWRAARTEARQESAAGRMQMEALVGADTIIQMQRAQIDAIKEPKVKSWLKETFGTPGEPKQEDQIKRN